MVGNSMKFKCCICLFFAFASIGELVSRIPVEDGQKQHFSPLFPPSKRVHPHYIERWTAPQISVKSLQVRHVVDRWSSPCIRDKGRALTGETSSNWSGYAAMTSVTNPASNSVSRVMGQWRVPTLHRSSSEEPYCDIWVGIDGYSNEVVQQAGTLHFFSDGKQYDYAWVELYPAWPFELDSFPVYKGDKMFVSVVREDSNTFIFTLKNISKHNKAIFSIRQPEALNQSAEWIVEAPSDERGLLPLANFRKVTFHNCLATIDGKFGSINSHNWTYAAITMRTKDSWVKSVPSRLYHDGRDFSVTWKHE